MVRVRHPCQAGSFYEGSSQALERQIRSCFLSNLGPGQLPDVAKNGPRRVVGLICPHAGYMFSGSVAAHAYYQLGIDGKPDTVFLLGPNHTGLGSGLATMNEGVWRTPLGDVEIDAETANEVVREAKIVDVDESAHSFEHSIEVQLPFLQYLFGGDFKIVPLCFLMQDLNSAREVGNAIGKIAALKNMVIIAS
jgi:AmmeMemoRadiSam system protein B